MARLEGILCGTYNNNSLYFCAQILAEEGGFFIAPTKGGLALSNDLEEGEVEGEKKSMATELAAAPSSAYDNIKNYRTDDDDDDSA